MIFLKQNKELFQKPINQIDWKKVYELALDDFKGSLGKFTEFWFQKNIHPEYYVNKIPEYFLANSSITSFSIPPGVISIEKSAFNGCSALAHIDIPSTVTHISDNAFENCSNLSSIKIPDSVMDICTSAFAFCKSLISANLGRGVSHIKDYAFYGCQNLTNIILGSNITFIGYLAFSHCNDLLIAYSGTGTQWKKVRKNYAFRDTSYNVRFTK